MGDELGLADEVDILGDDHSKEGRGMRLVIVDMAAKVGDIKVGLEELISGTVWVFVWFGELSFKYGVADPLA